MSTGLAQRILSNTAYNVLGHVWVSLVWIFLTPYIVTRLGTDRFGIHTLAGVAIGYIGLLDLGVGRSFVRHISVHFARDETNRVSGLVSTGMLFYSLFGALVLLVAFPLTGWFLSFFSIPSQYHAETAFVYRCSVIVYVGSTIISPMVSVQQALQRMDISNRIRVIRSTVNAAGVVLVLELGLGLKGLGMNSVAVFACFAPVHILVARHLLPGLRVRPLRDSSTREFRRLGGFGLKLQVARVAELLVFQADKVILGYFVGVGGVAVYQLGSSVISRIRQLLKLTCSAVLPAASTLHALDEEDRLVELYIRGTKYVGLVGFPAIGLAAAISEWIVFAWLGSGFGVSATVMQILCLGYLCNLLAGAGVTVSLARDKPGYQMHTSIVTTILNLFLNFALVVEFGLFGVAAATSCALVLGTLDFFRRLSKDMPVNTTGRLLRAVSKPFAFAAVPTALIVCTRYMIPDLVAAETRIQAGGLVACSTLAFAAAYLLLVLRGAALDRVDVEMIESYVPLARRILPWVKAAEPAWRPDADGPARRQ